MEIRGLKNALSSLSENAEKKNKTALVAQYIDEIETALSSGLKRKDVIDELNKFGLNFSLSTFETSLKRIRLKRLSLQPQNPVIPKASPSPTSAPTTDKSQSRTLTESNSDSHDPAELDKIISSRPDLNALAKLAKRKNK